MGVDPLVTGSAELVPLAAGTLRSDHLMGGSFGFDPLVSLLITLALTLVPSLMFVGLWRGLMYLRDDDLIEEARRMEAERAAQRATYDRQTQAAYEQAALSARGGVSDSEFETSTSDSVVICDSCHSRNVAGMDYCWDCLSRLPDE